ncbi:MAG: dienelactone hydrolase family protein [Acidimicrobiales bacterium]
MGEIVDVASNGGTVPGYIAPTADGQGIPLVVIQEWWGLVPHIQDVCDRFAAEGFVALAPDLYHGKATTEPDEAGKLMMALNVDQAAKDMSGAVDYVREHEASTGGGVGVTGFCAGGGLAMVLACRRPDAIKACVPWYGIFPWPHSEPDWSKLEASMLGHFAENDSLAPPDKVKELEARLRDTGKDVTFKVWPGVDHAFFNDTRPEVHAPDVSARAWQETLDFLRSKLG